MWKPLTLAASVLLAPAGALAADGERPDDAPPAALAVSSMPTIEAAPSSALDAVRATQAGAAARGSMTPAAQGRFAGPVLTASSLRIAHAARPDIFGTTALALGSTPFDARLRDTLAASDLGAAQKVARSLRALDRYDAILAANAFVNAKVAFLSDAAAHGTEDRWSDAAETLERGTGDCEDYAIAKLQLLRAAGFDAQDLHFVILKDIVRRADHAVLVVRHEDRFLVLDNGTDALLDSDAVRDYQPVFSFANGKAWTHGYAKPAPAAQPIFAMTRLTPTLRVASL